MPRVVHSSVNQERADAAALTSIVGGVINLVLSVAKIVVGLLGHSQALIADGLHSLSDLLSDLLVLLAGRQAAQAPDGDHPYGHERYEAVATLVLGCILLAVALMIAWEALHRLFNPEDMLQPGTMALTATIFSILVKEWLYWWTLGYAKRVRSELLRANAWHHRSDAISSVIVLLGILGTMAGLPYLDAIAAFIVALMIAHIAWDLGWQAVTELVDTGLETERVEAIRKTIRAVGGVRDIHNLRTRRFGDRASADVHVLVDPHLSVSEAHMVSLRVEHGLKHEVTEITDVTVHIDPEDDETQPPCLDLPLRAQVIERLAELWSAVPTANERERVVLHYLDGRIDLDVYFPLSTGLSSDSDPEGLRQLLTEALADAPEFGRLRLYFG